MRPPSPARSIRGTWKALVHAFASIRLALAMHDELVLVEPDRVELPWDPAVEERLVSARDAIHEARILVRPTNLGGSTYSGGFWLPETPEPVPPVLRGSGSPLTRWWRRALRWRRG
jgi:hypothetical protein